MQYSYKTIMTFLFFFFRKSSIAFIWITGFFCQEIYAAESSEKLDYKHSYSYRLNFDKHMSSKPSSDLTLSALELYRQAEDALYQQETLPSQLFVTLTRYLTASFLIIANHEIGGHGARGREFGVHPTGYDLNLFSGTTYFNGAKYNTLPTYKKIMIDIAGMQASYLLSHKIKFRYLESNKINPVYGIAYFLSKFDQPGYILSAKGDAGAQGHDVDNYLTEVNRLYGNKHLTQRKLKNYAYIDLLDPFLFYSLYSFISDQRVDTPFLTLGEGIGYLPAAHAILTPYGPEIGMLNLLKIGSKIVEIELNYGNNHQASSYALSIESHDVIQLDRFSLGGKIMAWLQPNFLTTTQDNLKKKAGGLFALNGQVTANQCLGVDVELGYKSAGFVVGESPEEDVFIRAGIQLTF